MRTRQNQTAKPRPEQARGPAHTRTALPAGPDYWPVPTRRTPAPRPQNTQRGETARTEPAEANATT